MSLAISLTVAAEDIRHLQHGHGRRGSNRRRSLHQPQPVEWTDDVADRGSGDVGIAGRGRQIAMAEQHLDRADIGARLEQMGGEAMAQGMDGDRLAELRPLPSAPDSAGLPWEVW